MKVVVTGPESTGKTTLSATLAKHFKISFVPEYARDYLSKKKGVYNESDLVKIAKGQIELENKLGEDGDKLSIHDTGLEVIQIWSEWKYDRCDPFIQNQAELRVPELFLLLKPDIPWHPDVLRENPEDRDKLFRYYQKTLRKYETIVVEISGTNSDRLQSSIEAIDKLLSSE